MSATMPSYGHSKVCRLVYGSVLSISRLRNRGRRPTLYTVEEGSAGEFFGRLVEFRSGRSST